MNIKFYLGIAETVIKLNKYNTTSSLVPVFKDF